MHPIYSCLCEILQNRTVMELRFLPTSITSGTANMAENHLQHTHLQNNNRETSPRIDQHNRRNQANRHQHSQPPPAFNGTLMNGLPPIQNMGSTTEIGIPQVTDLNNRIPSLRRTPRRTVPNGLPVPQSPRFMRSGMSNDVLNHNRSPISSRVAATAVSSKRHRLGGRNNENISCGSLNSIEV